jgi:hypothetical protein
MVSRRHPARSSLSWPIRLLLSVLVAPVSRPVNHRREKRRSELRVFALTGLETGATMKKTDTNRIGNEAAPPKWGRFA